MFLTIKDAIPEMETHVKNAQMFKRFKEFLNHHSFHRSDRNIILFFKLIAQEPNTIFVFKETQKEPSTQKNIICALRKAFDTQIIKDHMDDVTYDTVQKCIDNAYEHTKTGAFPVSKKSPLPTGLRVEDNEITRQDINMSQCDDNLANGGEFDNDLESGSGSINHETDIPCFDRGFEVNTGFDMIRQGGSHVVNTTNQQSLPPPDYQASTVHGMHGMHGTTPMMNHIIQDQMEHYNYIIQQIKEAAHVQKSQFIEKLAEKNIEIEDLKADVVVQQKAFDQYKETIHHLNNELNDVRQQLTIAMYNNPSYNELTRVVADFRTVIDGILNTFEFSPATKVVMENSLTHMFTRLNTIISSPTCVEHQ